MDKTLLAIAIILLALPAAHAQAGIIDYNLTLEIEGKSVKEHALILFEDINASFVVFKTEQISDLEVYDSRGELSYSYGQAEGGGFQIKVFPKGDRLLELFFRSDRLIFSSDSISQLFLELSLEIPVRRLHVDVILPPGDQANFYFPQNAKIGSDGKRIILSWDFESPTSIPLSVKYEPATKEQVLPLIALGILVAASLSVAYFFRRRAKQAFFTTLYEDERLVVERLATKKVLWQNKLEKELKFSRPKMTRIVKKLEERGWVAKERRGRTNKLTWIKGTKEERRLLSKIRKEKVQKEKENATKKEKQKEIVKRLFEGVPKER
jgi:DNA-binding MarR family transcriptional regulator